MDFVYNVIDTDHFGYSIVQECKSYMGTWHESHLVVLTRDKEPARYTRHRIATGLKKINVDYKTLNRPDLVAVLGEDPQRRDG